MAKGYKTGGRQKGSKNKVTGTVKEMISKSISKELESLPKLLDQLEPKERMDALIKLLPYLIPKAEKDSEEKDKLKHEDFVFRITQKIREANLKNAG